MNTVNASMTVIGAGSYGTALAITLARNGHSVVLWGTTPRKFKRCSKIAAIRRFCPTFPSRYPAA